MPPAAIVKVYRANRELFAVIPIDKASISATDAESTPDDDAFVHLAITHLLQQRRATEAEVNGFHYRVERLG